MKQYSIILLSILLLSTSWIATSTEINNALPEDQVTRAGISVVQFLRDILNGQMNSIDIGNSVKALQRNLYEQQTEQDEALKKAVTKSEAALADLLPLVDSLTTTVTAANASIPIRLLHLNTFDVSLVDNNFLAFDDSQLWGTMKADLANYLTSMMDQAQGLTEALTQLDAKISALADSMPPNLGIDDLVITMAKILVLNDVKQKCNDPCDPSPCGVGGSCLRSPVDPHAYTCLCQSGYLPPNCVPMMDLCTNGTCKNGGSCANNPDGKTHYCKCVNGWTGYTCEEDANDCSPFLCQNGGTCIDGRNSYSCKCRPGFSGKNCEVNVDDCAGSPCLNGALGCVDGVANFTCYCAVGFSGKRCEINNDDCAKSPCKNRGVCVDKVNDFQCNCIAGYSGRYCESDDPDCKPDSCMNGGQCMDGQNSYTCKCLPGFTGSRCETNIPDCKPTSCKNGGTCVDGVNSFACQCAKGWTGPTCDINVNDCVDTKGKAVCLNNGICADGINSFTCTCPAGWTGLRCEISSGPCAQNPCQQGGTCIVTASGGAQCMCPYGWTGKTCSQRAYLPSCFAIREYNNTLPSGVYTIQPSCSAPTITTYCDMDTDRGGWTMAAYAEDGKMSSSMNKPVGTFDPITRAGAANVDATALAQASNVMAISFNFGSKSANNFKLGDYENALSFSIPESTSVSMAPLTDSKSAFTCANYDRYVPVDVKFLAGGLGKYFPSKMYTGRKNLMTMYQNCYGVVAAPNQDRLCDWWLDKTAGYFAVYTCFGNMSPGPGVAWDEDNGLKQVKQIATTALWFRGSQTCSSPCQNGGRCVSVCPDVCDCSGTGRTGQYCSDPIAYETQMPEKPRTYLKRTNTAPQISEDGKVAGSLGEVECDKQTRMADGCMSVGSSACEAQKAQCVGFVVDALNKVTLISAASFPPKTPDPNYDMFMEETQYQIYYPKV